MQQESHAIKINRSMNDSKSAKKAESKSRFPGNPSQSQCWQKRFPQPHGSSNPSVLPRRHLWGGRLVAVASSLQSLGSFSPGSPCPPSSFCCSLGRAKGEHVPRVNKEFIPALPTTLSYNKISLKTRKSSCPLEMLSSNLSHFTKKLKPFDSQHRPTHFTQRILLFQTWVSEML